MSNDGFFSEQTEQSRAKSLIVTKYFWAWANVIIGSQQRRKLTPQIAYIDLFAGPGRYDDGSITTPLLVLEEAIRSPKIGSCLRSLFNDRDERNTAALEQAIDGLCGIEGLAHRPLVYNRDVGTEIVSLFRQMSSVPTLFFVDPWGYKGLSLGLIDSVIKDWGCDCVFFFNYNRVNMGLSNDRVKPHMASLFGDEEVERLRSVLEGLNAGEREFEIVESICQSLLRMGKARFVLPFRFRNESGSRTSHHLIFVTKHFKGYEIMKEIMAKESSQHTQGVASFEYSPATKRQALLFALTQPLDDLVDRLPNDLRGQKLTRDWLFEHHSVNTPYIKTNYNEALRQLEDKGAIEVERPKGSRIGQYGDQTLITFPS